MASGKQPITRHPLFPATVALWFGALFGIGSLAVRPALIESAIASAKLDAIVPLPMDMATRMLIAAALAGIGGMLGARLARRLGRPKTVARPRKRSRFLDEGDTASQSPEAETPTAPVARAGRRRQLAIPDPAQSDKGHLDRAPVPGATPVLNVSQIGIEGVGPEKERVDPEPDAITPTEGESAEEVTFLPGPAYESKPAVAPLETQPLAVEQTLQSRSANATLPRLSGEDQEPGFGKLPSKAQPLIDRAPDSDSSPPVQESSSDQATVTHDTAPISDASAAERIMSARVEDLGPIELLERLAISLRQKRVVAAHAADELPDVEPADETATAIIADEAEAKAAEPATAPTTSVVSPSSTIPAALRPIGTDPVDDDDVLPGYIPPRQIGPGRVPSSPPSAATEADDLDSGAASQAGVSEPVEPQEPLSSTFAKAQRMSNSA